ncbi:MAG: alpha-L-rhamnosidase C-terminal domain-containing protein [Acidobacteriaceae bacterium]
MRSDGHLARRLASKSRSHLPNFIAGTKSGILYGYMAGIHEDPAHPGFQHILHPQFDAALGNAGATYQSQNGSITSDWSYTGGTIA